MQQDINKEIIHELGEIKGLLKGYDKHFIKINGRVGSTEEEVSKIKLARAKERGIVIGITSVFATVFSLAGTFIGKHF